MSTKKSENVTTSELLPQVFLNPALYFGKLRIAVGTMELKTSDIDSGDIIVLDRFAPHAVPVSIRLWNDDLDSNGSPTLAFDCGVYRIDQVIPNPAVAVGGDQDAFASASAAFQSANLGSGTELVTERGISGEAAGSDRLQSEGLGRTLWEFANDFAAFPAPDGNPTDTLGGRNVTARQLDIALTITNVAATPVAGRLSYRIVFVVD